MGATEKVARIVPSNMKQDVLRWSKMADLINKIEDEWMRIAPDDCGDSKVAGRRMPATVIGKAFGFKQSTFKSISNRYRNEHISPSWWKWIQATMADINAPDPNRYGQWSGSEFDRMIENEAKTAADKNRKRTRESDSEAATQEDQKKARLRTVFPGQ
ncbi:hypothetical protein M422DRAFT_54246 [Sphaerobolus stellatus SS14]|nr:hypothetical protein M422DRAFT_54246 [Sphaerobolus stellatus SS14]